MRRRAVLARVERLVFGAWDPKAGAVGSLWDVVRDRRLNHRPEVVGGVREDECAALLDDFFGRRDGAGTGGSCNLVRGGVSERPKEHASKACVGKTTVGSNPTATAIGAAVTDPRCRCSRRRSSRLTI